MHKAVLKLVQVAMQVVTTVELSHGSVALLVLLLRGPLVEVEVAIATETPDLAVPRLPGRVVEEMDALTTTTTTPATAMDSRAATEAQAQLLGNKATRVTVKARVKATAMVAMAVVVAAAEEVMVGATADSREATTTTRLQVTTQEMLRHGRCHKAMVATPLLHLLQAARLHHHLLLVAMLLPLRRRRRVPNDGFGVIGLDLIEAANRPGN